MSSILSQSKKVDEIIVCDDCSLDRTIEIIKNISESNKDVDIRIYENESNLGVCANFEKAVCLCNGDIIFLSDQDDVWMPNKVECIVAWFENNPDGEDYGGKNDFEDSVFSALSGHQNQGVW